MYRQKQRLIGCWPGEKPRPLFKIVSKNKKAQFKSVLFTGRFRDSKANTDQSQPLGSKVAIPYLSTTLINSPQTPLISARSVNGLGPTHQPILVNNNVQNVQCARTPQFVAGCNAVTGSLLSGHE